MKKKVKVIRSKSTKKSRKTKKKSGKFKIDRSQPYKIADWDETDDEDLSNDEIETEFFHRKINEIKGIKKIVKKKYKHIYKNNDLYFNNLTSKNSMTFILIFRSTNKEQKIISEVIGIENQETLKKKDVAIRIPYRWS